MTINTKNGAVKLFEKNYIITKNTTKRDFLNSPLQHDIKSQAEYENGHSNYSLNPFCIDMDNKSFACLIIYFYPDEKINMIDICISDTSEDEWNCEKETARKKLHDDFLKTILEEHSYVDSNGNILYKYDWGHICSEYDPRSGVSTININYYQN